MGFRDRPFARRSLRGALLVASLELLSACSPLSSALIRKRGSHPTASAAQNSEVQTPLSSPEFAAFSGVIEKRCASCHDGGINGNFRMEESAWLLSGYLVPGKPEDSRIFNYLRGATTDKGPRNMPKAGNAIPDAEREAIRAYIASLKPGELAPCTAPSRVSRSANLLTADEFRYSLNDLLGFDPGSFDAFAFRTQDAYGFHNKPIDFKPDPVFLESLYDRLESLMDTAAKNVGGYPGLFSCGSTDYTNDACRSALVLRLADRAFRRSLSAAEKDSLAAAMASETDPLQKLQAGYLRALISPSFLFRLEGESIGGTTDERIAARLAGLLWLSVPDDTLRSLASQKQLRDPAVLSQQLKRLLADPRAVRFADVFSQDWLTLSNLDLVADTADLSADLKRAMKTETQLFLREVLLKRPAREVITANYSFLNKSLADYYQIKGPMGSSFEKTDLPASSLRRGVLSQGSILTATFKGSSDTRPVHRGKYLLARFLCDAPKGIVPANNAIDLSGLPAVHTFKDVLAAHRQNPSCAGCHQQLDPAGIAFDHFDGIGKYRTRYTARYDQLPVDTSEKLYGEAFQSSYDLMDVVAEQDKFYGCLATYAYAYLLRSPDETADACAVRTIASELKTKNASFADLIDRIASGELFLSESP